VTFKVIYLCQDSSNQTFCRVTGMQQLIAIVAQMDCSVAVQAVVMNSHSLS